MGRSILGIDFFALILLLLLVTFVSHKEIEVGQKLRQIRFDLVQVVTSLNTIVSSICKKTPSGDFLVDDLRLSPSSLTQVTLKLDDLSKKMRALLNNHLCKTRNGMLVALRRRINQQKKKKGMDMEEQVEKGQCAAEEDLEFFFACG